MRDILFNIAELKDSFRPSEHKIAKYILDNPEQVVDFTITELATACDTSEASIVRFCKTLNLKGFQDLKVKIAASLAMKHRSLDGGIDRDDSIADIVQKIVDFNKQAIEQTSHVTDLEALEQAVDILSEAKRIDFCGMGASGIIAYDAMTKFMRINIPCNYYQDSHLQLTSAANLSKDDAAVGISYSGTTKEVVEVLKAAKEKGASTISITKVGSSPLVDVADINLFVSSQEAIFRMGAMASRIAQLNLIDILFVSVAIKKYDEVIEYLENTSGATSIRKV